MKRHKEFLELFLQNQAALFGLLILRGIPPEQADDVLQNAATTLFEKFNEFEKGTNFRAWAFSVVRIEIKRFREKARDESSTLQLTHETLARLEGRQQDQPSAYFEEKREQLARCLGKLGTQARELLRLRYGDNLSFMDIARRQATTDVAVRVKVCRIRERLRKCISAGLQAVRTQHACGKENR